jgi:1,4-dihydroxy-2-naphthoate octaprenyltransferase
MATIGEWVEGARPRTLSAAVAPVAAGTGIAAASSAFHGGRAALALIVAIALQIGVNYANDYSDGVRGTDDVRVGPVRLVGQRLASPDQVRAASLLSLAIAAVAGFVLVWSIQEWWLLAVGAASIAAAWLYTGGPRPYGYAGLGEIFVLIFFGVVPVVGTAYVQMLSVTGTAIIAGLAIGSLSCAILLANNLRDIPTDTSVGKRTLAVRIGDAATRRVYVALLIIPFAAPVFFAATGSPATLITLIALLLAFRPVRSVTGGAVGSALIPVLKGTGLVTLVFGVLLGIGFALGPVLSAG